MEYMYMTDRFWELVTAKMVANLSPEEQMELEALCSQHPELNEVLHGLSQYWQQPATNPVSAEALYERHLARMADRFPEFSQASAPVAISTARRIVLGLKKYWAAAAVLVALAAALWVWAPFTGKTNPSASSVVARQMVNEVTTPPGNRSMLVLPDGTKVWVNANSRLAYDVGFGKDNRNLTLNGEAYFIAAKNKNLPLIVTTQSMVVKVTGTTFNVRAYDDEKKAETSLFEGSVTITPTSDTTNSYRLKPNQKLVVNQSSMGVQDFSMQKATTSSKQTTVRLAEKPFPQITLKALEVDPADQLIYEAAWVQNTLAFSDESFAEIAEKMENWYGVEITFANQQLADTRFTGKFTKETIAEALQALQFTARFQFRKNENRIYIF